MDDSVSELVYYMSIITSEKAQILNLAFSFASRVIKRINLVSCRLRLRANHHYCSYAFFLPTYIREGTNHILYRVVEMLAPVAYRLFLIRAYLLETNAQIDRFVLVEQSK
jgi:hypothetical protein